MSYRDDVHKLGGRLARTETQLSVSWMLSHPGLAVESIIQFMDDKPHARLEHYPGRGFLTMSYDYDEEGVQP